MTNANIAARLIEQAARHGERDAVVEARFADFDLPRPGVVRLDTTRAAALGVRLRPVGEVVPLR